MRTRWKAGKGNNKRDSKYDKYGNDGKFGKGDRDGPGDDDFGVYQQYCEGDMILHRMWGKEKY